MPAELFPGYLPRAEVDAIERSTDLHALEQIVERGAQTFIEVGLALERIRSAKLYTMTHSSWDSYLAHRWNWSRSYANRLRTAAAVATALPNGAIENEAQARELAKVEPEKREAVLEKAGPKPTASKLREAAATGKSQTYGNGIQNMRTPPWLIQLLTDTFGPLHLDAYAEEGDDGWTNAVCDEYYTAEDDGHEAPWVEGTFWNPEFKEMAKAIAKAHTEGDLGNENVGIGPAGTSSNWFHEHAKFGTIYVPDCRVNFLFPDGSLSNRQLWEVFVYGFGGPHVNPDPEQFRVFPLPTKKYRDAWLASLKSKGGEQ